MNSPYYVGAIADMSDEAIAGEIERLWDFINSDSDTMVKIHRLKLHETRLALLSRECAVRMRGLARIIEVGITERHKVEDLLIEAERERDEVGKAALWLASGRSINPTSWVGKALAAAVCRHGR